MIGQADSIAKTGFSIALIVFILLCLIWVSNVMSTFYLYRLEIKLTKKQRQAT